MDFALKTITEHHSEAARELAEHLDCKGDQCGLGLLAELLDYDVMLVRFLNDWPPLSISSSWLDAICFIL
jgi:hypothetical protein